MKARAKILNQSWSYWLWLAMNLALVVSNAKKGLSYHVAVSAFVLGLMTSSIIDEIIAKRRKSREQQLARHVEKEIRPWH